LKASAQRSQYEQRFAQAQLDAKLANQILASFWTVDVDTELPVVDVLDSPPALPVEIVGADAQQASAALSQRPELARLDALGRTFLADRKIARAGLRPDANLVFQYGLDANQVRSDQLGYAAFVNVNVPVFDWFRSRSGAREASYHQEQTRIQRSAAERALTQEYLAARSRVQSWHERISMAQSETDAARENLRLVRLLYENGEGAALDVVISQADATQAGRSYYSAVAEYQRAIADFELAAGR
jgi:outer membrane protein TolC